MDIKKAVTILIENSYFLAYEDKVSLLSKIDQIPEAELIMLGKLLAHEKRLSLKNAEKTIKECDEQLELLDQNKMSFFKGFKKKIFQK